METRRNSRKKKDWWCRFFERVQAFRVQVGRVLVLIFTLGSAHAGTVTVGWEAADWDGSSSLRAPTESDATAASGTATGWGGVGAKGAIGRTEGSAPPITFTETSSDPWGGDMVMARFYEKSNKKRETNFCHFHGWSARSLWHPDRSVSNRAGG